MFDLLRRNRGRRDHSSRQVARERVQSAIRRDRMEVSTPELSALRDRMLFTIGEYLPVAPEFTEFGIRRDGDEVFLVSRVRLQTLR
jgi:septum formation topological specificity factor MinE